MSPTSATTPAWEEKLRDDMALSVPTLNMISIQSLDAIETTRFDDNRVTDRIKHQLISIHIVSVQSIQTATGTCIDTIQSLSDTQPNRDVRDATIRSACSTAIKNFSDQFDDAGNEAVKMINLLPPAQQYPAANFFSSSMAIVHGFANQASAGLSIVDSRYLREFLAGN
ncbi:hypothetical protein FMUND_8500 [Fusarium mundagurra]|uniref:Uncharacterized protein n=1 Tax=Fusarium mundagurra TaxID=1567541 RepID=A0A8H5YJE7_9HYPO|nr:hypothetical protein FMUND_8500 [Fusarium mundagurra]